MDEPREIILLSSAQRALAEARTVDDVKNLRDKAVAVRHYARQAKLGQDLVIEAAVVKLRAERRIGQILRETPLATGIEGNQYDQSSGEPNGVLLQDLGISKSDSSRMQRIANLDGTIFEDYITSESESQREPTAAGVLRLIRSQKPVSVQTGDEQIAECKTVASLDELVESGVGFSAILVNLLSASMPYEQLETLPVSQLLDATGTVHLWTNAEILLETLDLADAWGFAYCGLQLFVPPKNLMPEQSPHLLLCFRHESTHDIAPGECTWTICPQPEEDGIPQAVYRQIAVSQPGDALAIHTGSPPLSEDWTAYGNQVQE